MDYVNWLIEQRKQKRIEYDYQMFIKEMTEEQFQDFIVELSMKVQEKLLKKRIIKKESPSNTTDPVILNRNLAF